ncbi:Secreted protein containing C-terminal beta-propeller domain [Asanoa hainanensis]|uniref:Secreted protein containing C-terminal beta-propeller domain n=1 Tax=Asanoa hainanensis TaxID=560556 RepID=A0A239MUL3_9ACTN|nr:beta-propeller domain-containing protein [Asanoa hainanensis]SNT46436.1 Secreted protein containing C-terminal beta-propeller domain [Asanoa hainanensis]
MAFESCDDVLAGLKRAAKDVVTPWGFEDGFRRGIAARTGVEDLAGGAVGAAADAVAKQAPGSEQSGYSGTNTHEAGVDEPDLVKTDGRRIVTVSGNTLRVIDPTTRRLTGSVSLADDAGSFGEPNLLLSGDRAMVLMPAVAPFSAGVIKSFAPWTDTLVRLVTVDLAGTRPAVVGSYTIDGSLVDARQVGDTARLVVRSRPRLDFPYRENATDTQRLRANRALIDRSTIADWLPRWTASNGGSDNSGRIDCGALRKPDAFSGTSLMTVLTFDIGGRYGTGDPTTIVADGDFVYSNGTSLYVANDQRWRLMRADLGRPAASPADLATVIYRFDITGSGAPRFVASGSVPGNLINQYAMSEHEGHLRVAATLSQDSSSVYVLRSADMVRTGVVNGLGKGERIYAVRFVGPVGYVVTFRQTDPLYTLDLADPAAPVVRGELKINGYSSYLHPLDAGRLVGVGQDADSQGRVSGAQISVFDVSDLREPRRVAQHRVKDGWSEAESDPHAFLYWPDSKLLVVPMSAPAHLGVLALRVSESGLEEVGTVRHPRNETQGYEPMIRRSLIVDGTLWTISDTGVRATDSGSMRDQAWIPYT